MRALAIRRGDTTPSLIEVPRPEPAPGEALVRTLRVGIDGTDAEVIAGAHGEYPPGDDYLVLGHEAVGVVEDANGTELKEGQVVVPTVRRRPNDGTNEYFERGQPDMAPPEMCIERGIAGAHGFAAEYFTSPGEYLVGVPQTLAPLGFLVEPVSISEKALELAYASRSSFDWRPESAVVLGNGPLGLLTLAMLQRSYDRVYCLGRRDRPDPTVDLMEAMGATYVDSRETPVDEVAEAFEPMDLVFEATGYAPHGVQSVHALAPNGVTALLGVPGSIEYEFDVGAMHSELVLHNKAVVGSVNSNVRHFEAATDTIDALPAWLFDDLVTGIYPVDDFRRAFHDDNTVIKTAVEFSAYEER